MASFAAMARCRSLRGHRRSPGLPACSECSAVAEACDVAVAVECELDAVPPEHDPFLVDEVAIRRALAGERVVLSPYEWHVVVRLLSARLSPGQIVHRLQFGGVRVADRLGAFIHPADRAAAVPPTPTDHVEDVVVDARLAGSPVGLSPHELNTACWRLSERGQSVKAIARRLGVRDRTVAKALRSRRIGASASTVVVLERSALSVPAHYSPLLGAA